MVLSEFHTAVKVELDKTSALELPSFEPEEIDFWLDKAIRKFVKTRYSGLNVKRQGFEETQKRIDDLRTLVTYYSDTTPDTTTEKYPNGYRFLLPCDTNSTGNEDYWLTVAEEVNISTDSDVTRTRVGITECTLDEYRFKLDDPYSEHRLHYATAKPLRIYYGDSVEFISDGNYSVEDYFLTYIKKPTTPDISTDVASGSIKAGVRYEVVEATGAQYVTYNSSNYYGGDTFLGVSGVTTYTESGGTIYVYATVDLPEHTHEEVVKLAVSMMLENIEQPRYQSYQNELNTME